MNRTLRRTRRLALSLGTLGGGLLVATLLDTGHAEERTRVDLYDLRSGQREGYVVIDQRSGRLDAVDRNSKRIGWGQVQPPPVGSGVPSSVDAFKLDGQRRGSGATPRGGRR